MGVSEISNETVSTIESTLNLVDQALDRLRAGTYRSCEVCAAPITDEELASDPLRTSCVAHPKLV